MKYKLKELADISSSKRIYYSEYTNKGIPFYRGKEIIEKTENKDISNKLFISKERYDELKIKYGVPQKGDIIMTAVGTLGKCWLVDSTEFYFKDGNCLWFYNFNRKINNKYLYYYMCSNFFQNKIDNICIGSTQKALTIQQLKEVNINLPCIETQNKIVKILDNICHKIRINSQTNDNLYEITNKLYEQLFVIERQDDWKEYNLQELMDISNGYSYTGKELVDTSVVGMATIKNFERTGGFKEEGFKDIEPIKAKDIHYADKFDILVACTDLTQNADIIGNAIMLLNIGKYEKVVISMDLVKILPKKNKYLVFSILNSKEFKNFALGYKTGTTVLHLNKNCFKDFHIKLPDFDKIENFEKVVETNYKKISYNLEENNTLTQLRDTLLPKLMNGEIDLDKIEI